MKRILLIILCIAGTAFSTSKAEKALMQKEGERKDLQNSLEKARDSLQVLITHQYAFKQTMVETREANKEELDKRREAQERLENELARIKEEKLSREQALDDERKNLTAKQEEWKYLNNQIKDILQKDADGLIEVFPLDRELRRMDLEKIRASLSETNSPGKSFAAFVNYRLHWFDVGNAISLTKAAVAVEEGGLKQLTIARFGNVLGYGIDSGAAQGTCYYLRQTGRLGTEKYSVERIAAPNLANRLLEQFPKWLQAGKVAGNVMLEVMQNDQARMLIEGKRQSTGVALYERFAKGGFIMIPMLLLPFWIFYLVFVKAKQYSKRGKLLKRQFEESMKYLEKKDFDGALQFAKSCKSGIMARIVQSCVERRRQGRDAGERAVYELLALEAPPLRRGLNTLAVIAGAAPLMGLLGTISGMITLFAAVTHHGTGDPKFLAGGISEALITAMTGLAIAIPTLFIHDLTRGAKDRLMANMESNAISILNIVYPED